MKTLTICKKTAVICLCLGTAAPLFAQNPLVQGARGLFVAPRATRGTVQRFVFPRQTVDNIRRTIATGQLDRQAAAGMVAEQSAAYAAHARSAAPATGAAPLPAGIPEAAVSPTQAAMDARLQNFYLVSRAPVEKEILSVMLEENKFYAPEIDAGRAIRNQILDITVLTDEGQAELAMAIQQNIKNHTLKQALLENLENFDIYNMALDLTDYFCLDKAFEDAAVNYTLRHPHQMNLNTRRLMYNPLVDESVKNRLRYFLEAPSLSPQEYEQFRAAVRTAHLQYQQRLGATKYSDVIQAQVAYYEDFARRLDNFIVRNNGVQPKWNTTNPKEQLLFDEYQDLIHYDFINRFNPILTYRKQLQVIWDTAQAPRTLGLEETVALYEEFVKTTGRRYPNSLRNTPEPGEIPFEQEELLYDSLSHWRIQNEATIGPMLDKVLAKYPHLR